MQNFEPLDIDEEAARNAAIMARNEDRARAKLAAGNRAAGHPEPQPGDRLYVSTSRAIKQRSRAGIVFSSDKRRVVEVVGEGGSMDLVPGSGVDATVSAYGAEMILADDGLNVTSTHVGGNEIELRAEADRLKAEVDKLRADNARLVREARMGAADSGDGKSGRLAAARAARGALKDEPGDDFGGATK